MLDLIHEIDVVSAGSQNQSHKRIIFTQPGLRYAEAEALSTSLIQDETFRDLGIRERNRVTERILDEIKGRMMEDIILLETAMAHAELQVFVLQFAIGEFDMVTCNPVKMTCSIYEVKHSREAVPEQYRHLVDEAKLKETTRQYGDITGRYVIYNGNDHVQDDIRYINAEEYLKQLKDASAS